MEEAHDLLELKELISRLGLKDDRRQSPRYNVSIAGNYSSVQAAVRVIGQVVEGYHAARAVRKVARQLDVDMPICDHVYRVIYEGLDIGGVAVALMNRAVSAE